MHLQLNLQRVGNMHVHAVVLAVFTYMYMYAYDRHDYKKDALVTHNGVKVHGRAIHVLQPHG